MNEKSAITITKYPCNLNKKMLIRLNFDVPDPLKICFNKQLTITYKHRLNSTTRHEKTKQISSGDEKSRSPLDRPSSPLPFNVTITNHQARLPTRNHRDLAQQRIPERLTTTGCVDPSRTDGHLSTPPWAKKTEKVEVAKECNDKDSSNVVIYDCCCLLLFVFFVCFFL